MTRDSTTNEHREKETDATNAPTPQPIDEQRNEEINETTNNEIAYLTGIRLKVIAVAYAGPCLCKYITDIL